MMIYPPHNRLLLARGVGEIRRTCPVITPTLGAELLTNGDMSSTTGWTIPAEWSIGSGIATATNATDSYLAQASKLTSGLWYQMGLDILTRTAGGVRLQLHGTILGDCASVATFVMTGRANGTSINFRAINNASLTADNATVLPLTLSTCLTYLGRRTKRPGTYICAPTLTANTQCGLWICYRDANNFVLTYHDGTNAKLEKCIAGTYTSVISAAATYVAGAQLKVIIAANGTDYSLYYNGSAVGTTQAITDAGLGRSVFGFSTLSSNRVGEVLTSGATS